MTFSPFQVFCDPYQVFIATDVDGYTGGGANAMYFSSPWISPYATVATCAFLRIGWSICRNTLWESFNCATVIDGTRFDHNDTPHDNETQGFSLLLDQQPTTGVKLWTTDPRFYQDSVVMLSKGPTDQKAVGYLYNSFITGEDPSDVAIAVIKRIKISGTLYSCLVMANNTRWSSIGAAPHATMYLLTE